MRTRDRVAAAAFVLLVLPQVAAALPVISEPIVRDYRLTGREGSDVSFLPAPLEWAFGTLLRAEARALTRVSFPVGASVFALARKPAAA